MSRSHAAPPVLQLLSSSEGFPRVSAYIPTHRTFPDCEQDPIRLGNARREAERQLEAAGWSIGRIGTLLAEVADREKDSAYWNYQDEGLAVFIDEGDTRWLKLPMQVPELVIVAERFHVRPLIRGLRDAGTFYVIAVTEDDAKLYKSVGDDLVQVNVENLPEGTGKIRGMTDLDADVGFHARDRGSRPGGSDAPGYAALGDSPEDYQEVILEQYAREIAKAVDAHLANTRAPLVIAAVARTAGHLKPHFDYTGVLDDMVTSDPGALRDEE
ncbi:MAG: hypothetical protein KKB37_04170, partial [Alphaproteobacteria bacterium]|nr:hypothetical protein [Alphaproteobacteria bacterium]